MAADKLKAQEARELYVLKQKAIKYYEENGVPQRMEEILNSTFYDTPNDVYGHIVSSDGNLQFHVIYKFLVRGQSPPVSRRRTLMVKNRLEVGNRRTMYVHWTPALG